VYFKFLAHDASNRVCCSSCKGITSPISPHQPSIPTHFQHPCFPCPQLAKWVEACAPGSGVLPRRALTHLLGVASEWACPRFGRVKTQAAFRAPPTICPEICSSTPCNSQFGGGGPRCWPAWWWSSSSPCWPCTAGGGSGLVVVPLVPLSSPR
jgi:hypothetical protein